MRLCDRQTTLKQLGIACTVVALSLISRRACDHLGSGKHARVGAAAFVDESDCSRPSGITCWRGRGVSLGLGAMDFPLLFCHQALCLSPLLRLAVSCTAFALFCFPKVVFLPLLFKNS